jgi:glycosyltransferase involved in cell wall biosynthesis
MSDVMASVVLPVYNQADHIFEVLTGFADHLRAFDGGCELIAVVNGRNQEESWAECRRAAQEWPSIRLVRSEQGGWGRAVRTGLAEARGDILCFTNSARTTPEDLLLALRYASRATNAVIKVERQLRAGWLRRLGSLLYNLQVRALFDLPNWDVNGTPKVFSRSHDRLMSLREDGDLLDLEFMAACRAHRYQVVVLPVLTSARHGGASTTGVRSAIRLYWGALRLRTGRRQT